MWICLILLDCTLYSKTVNTVFYVMFTVIKIHIEILNEQNASYHPSPPPARTSPTQIFKKILVCINIGIFQQKLKMVIVRG